MTQKSFRFGVFLAFTTSLYGATAFAAHPAGTYENPSYLAAQTLPDLSPAQIASEVEARFDPLTGRTEYIARDFDPFESDQTIAGSALLRSASTGISRDGANITGGAFLDVSVLYSSTSRDPYDSKGLEYAVYMNGQPVDVMRYDVQTLDCQRDVTKVTYDDGYYRGSAYGYVGGLYRPFPRYRGHNHYYRQSNRIHLGTWRNLTHRYVNHHGYNHRNRHGAGSRGTHHTGGNNRNYQGGNHQGRNHQGGNRDRDRDNHGTRGGNAGRNVDIGNRTRDREDHRDRDRDLARRTPDSRVITTRNVIDPNRLGERRLSNTRENRTETRPVKSPIRRALQPVKAPHSTHTTTRSTPHVAPTRQTTTRPVVNTNRPAVQHRQRSSTPSAPAPRTQTRTQTRTETRSAPAPRSRPSNRSSNRTTKRPSTDRAFQSRNPKNSRARHYYPGGTYQTTYDTTNCVKEERLSLHIPADRLLAARFDGLSIAMLDREGNDVPLYIPPNYIEGFLQANPYMRAGTGYPEFGN